MNINEDMWKSSHWTDKNTSWQHSSYLTVSLHHHHQHNHKKTRVSRDAEAKIFVSVPRSCRVSMLPGVSPLCRKALSQWWDTSFRSINRRVSTSNHWSESPRISSIRYKHYFSKWTLLLISLSESGIPPVVQP